MLLDVAHVSTCEHRAAWSHGTANGASASAKAEESHTCADLELIRLWACCLCMRASNRSRFRPAFSMYCPLCRVPGCLSWVGATRNHDQVRSSHAITIVRQGCEFT